VNVISNSTDTDCRTPKLIRGRGEIFMEIASDGWFGETGLGQQRHSQNSRSDLIDHLTLAERDSNYRVGHSRFTNDTANIVIMENVLYYAL
jgi:hypothetical protein